MVGLPPKKIPPPPRQPGTHTNAEVKEALHARALRRTIIVTAVVILLLAALAVVSSIAQEYQGDDDSEKLPKAVVIVANGLTHDTWVRAVRSNKSPFTRLLDSSGGVFGTLNSTYGSAAETSKSQLYRILTGVSDDSATEKTSLAGATSFLRVLKKSFKPVIVAPASFWSSNQVDGTSTACSRIGFFDSECSSTSCPQENAQAYCNAYRKYVSCDSKAQLYTDDIVAGFSKTVKEGADLMYVQVSDFEGDSSVAVTIDNTLERRSEINLFDSAIGRIAMALALRTKVADENWLIAVVGDTANASQTSPVLVAAYSNGQLLQLRRPSAEPVQSDLHTTDLQATILKWFNVPPADLAASRLIGICSNGYKVANCVSAKA